MSTALATIPTEFLIEEAIEVLEPMCSITPEDRKMVCGREDEHRADYRVLMTCGCVNPECESAVEREKLLSSKAAKNRPGLRGWYIYCDTCPGEPRVTVVAVEPIR